MVVESGASLFAHTDGFDETIAVAQMQGEPATLFAQRALARIASIERSGRHFESMAVLAGGRSDAGSKAARRLIVLGLSSHARAIGQPAELLLHAYAHASVQERSELLELVGEATDVSGSLSVRLCFGEPPAERPVRRSGVFPKPVQGRKRSD